MSCSCKACAALLAECGPDLFPMYSRKLLIHGWAGSMSAVEKAYRRVHRSEAQQKAVAASAERFKTIGSTRQSAVGNARKPVGVQKGTAMSKREGR